MAYPKALVIEAILGATEQEHQQDVQRRLASKEGTEAGIRINGIHVRPEIPMLTNNEIHDALRGSGIYSRIGDVLREVRRVYEESFKMIEQS